MFSPFLTQSDFQTEKFFFVVPQCVVAHSTLALGLVQFSAEKHLTVTPHQTVQRMLWRGHVTCAKIINLLANTVLEEQQTCSRLQKKVCGLCSDYSRNVLPDIYYLKIPSIKFLDWCGFIKIIKQIYLSNLRLYDVAVNNVRTYFQTMALSNEAFSG